MTKSMAFTLRSSQSNRGISMYTVSSPSKEGNDKGIYRGLNKVLWEYWRGKLNLIRESGKRYVSEITWS